MKRPELLVPASSLEVLKVAVIYGADAVYIGGEAFGLRAKAKNFSKEDMREGIAFAHAHGPAAHPFCHGPHKKGKDRIKFQQRGYGRGNRLCACTWCKGLCDSEYPGT